MNSWLVIFLLLYSSISKTYNFKLSSCYVQYFDFVIHCYLNFAVLFQFTRFVLLSKGRWLRNWFSGLFGQCVAQNDRIICSSNNDLQYFYGYLVFERLCHRIFITPYSSVYYLESISLLYQDISSSIISSNNRYAIYNLPPSAFLQW